MKITRLHVKNVKCLDEIDFAVPPEVPVIYVTGPNGSGKTATLDAILYALAGKTKIPESVVRNGAGRAEIELTLDDGSKIKRTITEGSSALTYLRPDGGTAASPQRLLDRMVGAITLDPWAFCRAAPAVRRTMILDAAGDPAAIKDADEAYRDAYNERTLRKRALKQAETLLAEAPPLDAEIAEAQPTDTAPLRKRLRAIQENAIQREKLLDRAASLDERIKQALASIEVWRDEAAQARAAADVIPADDFETAQLELDAAEDLNRRIAESAEARLRLSEVHRLRDAVADIEVQVGQAEMKRKALLAKVSESLPINDLDVDENEVLVRGIRFEALSTAEQLKVAVAIATASNPTLRIIRVTDGSLLDAASRRFLDGVARQLDLQIWVEDVRETGGAGIELVFG